MRPVVATLAGADLRIGEAVALDWRDVKLSTGTLIVRESKTASGEGREVHLTVGLQEEPATWRARNKRTRLTDPVFVSRMRNGRQARHTRRNVHARLATTVKKANKQLAELGIYSIVNATPHSLRRTYANLRATMRDDPVYIAEQLGHSNLSHQRKGVKQWEMPTLTGKLWRGRKPTRSASRLSRPCTLTLLSRAGRRTNSARPRGRRCRTSPTTSPAFETRVYCGDGKSQAARGD
jgi:integrase